MTQVDKLNDVHSVCRAQAVEDFEFFVHTVLGVRIESSLCALVQKEIEQGDEASARSHLSAKQQSALSAWLSVIGKSKRLQSAPTETFSWLFGNCVERRCEERAA